LGILFALGLMLSLIILIDFAWVDANIAIEAIKRVCSCASA